MKRALFAVLVFTMSGLGDGLVPYACDTDAECVQWALERADFAALDSLTGGAK